MKPRRKTLQLALVLGALVTAPAIAQQSPSAYPPACETSKVSKSDVERAHTVFLSGKQYLEESNYEKAISYFKDAYSIDCSIHAILPIIATAYERKGDRGEAVHALEEYQKRAPTAPDHEVIDRRIRNLKDQLAREQPAPTPSATAQPAPSASVAPTPSVAPAATGPMPAPSSTASPPTGETVSNHSAGPWIVIGVGGAVLVAGVIVYVLGSGDVSSAEGACPNHQCPKGDTTDASKGNDGRTLETAGGVLMGVGAAGVAAGIALHILEPPRPAGSSPSARLVPVVRPAAGGSGSFAGLSLTGSF